VELFPGMCRDDLVAAALCYAGADQQTSQPKAAFVPPFISLGIPQRLDAPRDGLGSPEHRSCGALDPNGGHWGSLDHRSHPAISSRL